jgi:hypothetical protein
MNMKLTHAVWIAAAMAVAWQPGTGWAVVIATQPDITVDIENGTYNDPNALDGMFTINPNGGGFIVSFDATFSGLATFESSNTVFIQQMPGAGNTYDYDITDTTDTYELQLVLDNWSELVAGQSGADFGPTSDVVNVNNSAIVDATNFTGQLEVVPAPAALPVFATALGLLGAFRRRWRRSATMA